MQIRFKQILDHYGPTLAVCNKRLDAYHVALQHIAMTGAVQGAILLADAAIDGRLVVRLSFGLEGASNKIIRAGRIGTAAAYESYRTAQPLLVRYGDNQAYVPSDLEVKFGVETAYFSPLRQGSEAIGTVMSVPAAGVVWDAMTLEFIDRLVGQLGERLNALSEMRGSDFPAPPEGEHHWDDALTSALQECLDTADIEMLSDKTLDYCRALTGSAFGFAGYLDAQTGFLICPTMTKEIYPSCGVEGKTVVFEKAGGLGGVVLDSQEALVANDPLSHPASVGTPSGHLPIRKFMGVPCKHRGSVVGMIALANKEEDYTAYDLGVVRAFAAIYAAAVGRFFADTTLAAEKEKFEALYHHAPAGYYTLKPDGTIDEMNATLAGMLGYERSELIGQSVRQIVTDAGIEDINAQIGALSEGDRTESVREIGFVMRGGEQAVCLHQLRGNRDDRGYLRDLFATVTDITAMKKMDERIRFLAYYDELTGLYNKAGFMQHAVDACGRICNDGERGALFLLGLDRFKDINETFGHDVGDKILETVAGRIAGAAAKQSLLGRFGGDEFVIFAGYRDDETAIAQAADFLALFKEPFTVEGKEVFITASLGIALSGSEGDDEMAMLYRHADIAMNTGKEQRRSTIQLYNRDIEEARQHRHRLETDLRRALENGEMYVVYQPQTDLETGRVTGAEALARWRHPTLGTVSPAEFIPIAEESGIIVDIGAFVIRQACRDFLFWRAGGGGIDKISVNVSGIQLKFGLTAADVVAMANDAGIDPSVLDIELTESILMEQTDDVAQTMQAFRNAGMTVSIDDFGTGYSSLSYLKRFPVSALKIDQSFVREIGEQRDAEAICRAVIAMANALNLQVVAEGIETAEQLAFLKANGCTRGQGYFFARPVPADEFATLLKSARSGAAVN